MSAVLLNWCTSPKLSLLSIYFILEKVLQLTVYICAPNTDLLFLISILQRGYRDGAMMRGHCLFEVLDNNVINGVNGM